jgi:hypothetical protein
MRFIQIGPISRAPTGATPRRPINPRSLRPQRRYNSDSTKNGPKAPEQPQNAPPSPNQTAVAAGAATVPSTSLRSRGILDVIMAGPIGKSGRWYARMQERKPYATQLWSSIIIYLCGDLSAQILFPTEVPAPARDADADTDADEKRETVTAGYDPYRTLRHLCVGVGSSIPSYKW